MTTIATDWETVDRPRGARRAAHRHQAVLRVPQRASAAEPNTNVCPVCLGSAGLAAGAQPDGGRVRHAHRHGPALPDPAVDLPPEELLLSGHAQGLPDQPVRHPHQRRRLAGAAGRPADRHRAGPHGRGHRQDDSCRRRRPHPRGSPLAGGLQPGRRPAGRDRQRPRPPGGRGGPDLRRRAARHPGGDRGFGRKDGGGVAAGRRQRVGPARRRPPQFGTRCEIKNLNSLRSLGPGHRIRGGPPDRT